MEQIHPFILAGGAGTRLWPLSRPERPKPFLAPSGTGPTLLQQALQRLRMPPFASPVILCQQEHRFTALRQAFEAGAHDASLLLEPSPRNTAASAIAAALHCLARHGERAVMMLLPADHLLAPADAFARAAEKALAHTGNGAIVTFGIPPTKPHDGYGYLIAEAADTSGGAAGTFRVRRFVEKPDTTQAARLLAGEAPVFWNAGIFLCTAGDLVAAFERHAPVYLSPCRDALQLAAAEGPFLHLDAEAWRGCPQGQFDRVIMERHDNILCVPLACEWHDLGSWPALHDALPQDRYGNTTTGAVCLSQTRNSLAIAMEGHHLVLLGLSDMIAIAMRDVVMLASRDHAADVAALARQCGLAELPATRGERPWGSYVCLARGEGYQVKLLHVAPGARLSLQRHARRTEHWIVLDGRARAWRDGEPHDIGPGSGIGIPAGSWHRLENPDAVIAARILEIQCGDYLGEDDIERRDDDYGRC